MRDRVGELFHRTPGNRRLGRAAANGVSEQPLQARRVLPVVLLLLFATGWAANHFTAMLPVLARSEGLAQAALDGAFGIYAVGLLPGLLGGGSLSDRSGVGRFFWPVLRSPVLATWLCVGTTRPASSSAVSIVGVGVGMAMQCRHRVERRSRRRLGIGARGELR